MTTKSLPSARIQRTYNPSDRIQSYWIVLTEGDPATADFARAAMPLHADIAADGLAVGHPKQTGPRRSQELADACFRVAEWLEQGGACALSRDENVSVWYGRGDGNSAH